MRRHPYKFISSTFNYVSFINRNIHCFDDYFFSSEADVRPNIYSSDSEEDSDFDDEKEARQTKRLNKAKKLDESDDVSLFTNILNSCLCQKIV